MKNCKVFWKVLWKKEKCSIAFQPIIFTAGIHTTSRAESTNSAIKKYLRSKSELSDIIDFITNYEEATTMSKPNIKGVDRSESHPLMQKIKNTVTSYAYDLMREQFILSSSYKVEKLNLLSFKVVVVEGSHYAKYHLVNLIDSKFIVIVFILISQK